MTPLSTPPQYYVERTVEATVPSIAQWTVTAPMREPRHLAFALTQPAAIWLNDAIQQVSDLTALAPDWDSYGAKAVNADAAIDAVQLLLKIAYPEISAPSIVPLADGGLQLEWHRGGIDVEIVLSDDEPGIYIEDNNMEGETVEAPLSAAVSEIGRRISQLSQS